MFHWFIVIIFWFFICFNAKANVIKELDNEYQIKCYVSKNSKIHRKYRGYTKSKWKSCFRLEQDYNNEKETNKKLLKKVNDSEKLIKESEEKRKEKTWENTR